MSKVYETLKKKNDTSVEVYPNIERTNIPDGAINTAKIEDNSITTNKIVDDAVTTAKINDGAVTEAKMGFHLYEHNIIVATNNDISEADDVVIFKVLTTDNTPLTDSGDIASLLYERGFGKSSPLMATGRYSDDSFEVVTGVDWGAQSDTTDYCETYIIGVYGTNADELKVLVCTLSENETTKITDTEISASYINDNVVTLF